MKWMTPDDQLDCCYTFGNSAEVAEHCNVFVYYWPKVESDVFCAFRFEGECITSQSFHFERAAALADSAVENSLCGRGGHDQVRKCKWLTKNRAPHPGRDHAAPPRSPGGPALHQEGGRGDLAAGADDARNLFVTCHASTISVASLRRGPSLRMRV